MDELGHILREARETKGLTLQEVQAETRISSRYLEALENGDYDRLPTPVHVRGFLRNYARFLGLDPQPLLDRYEYGQGKRPKKKTETFSNQQPVAPALKEPPSDQPFFEPVNMEVDAGFSRRAGGPRSETILRLVIIAALIGLIYLAGQRFIPLLTGNGDGTERLTEDIQGAVQNLLNQVTPTPEATDTPELVPDELINPTGRNDFTTESGGVSTTLPTALPTRPPLPATMDTILLELLILSAPGWK
ncbi:MAG TPA: helix-turn-helix domain-containing protein [Chloroflexota bacterium]|nr:helix-turn-helix domain-containing protein [Chloroflexota bacterium]